MEIKGKVHCFFEQSGTFKNEFIKLGIPAEDYDIQNNFGQTDNVIDLFKAIEDAYDGKPSVFDNITKDDLIIAFFPCIYFCDFAQMVFSLTNVNFKNMDDDTKFNKILKQADDRNDYFKRLIKFCGYCLMNDIRMVFENPHGTISYLKTSFLKPPSIIDYDRTTRGDFFRKPTAYWFWNCEPTNGETIQILHKAKSVKKDAKGSGQAGLCSEERSMISPDYARNFICDFILGKKQDIGQLTLF